MNNVIYVAQLIEELDADQDFLDEVEELGLKELDKEKIKQSMLLKALELNNTGIYIPKESWETIYKEALDKFSVKFFTKDGKPKAKPRGFESFCVFSALTEYSPVEIPTNKMVDNGEFDPHYNPYSDGNHFTF